MTTLVAIATAQSRRFFATELAPSMAHHGQSHAGSEFGAWECPETLIQCDIRICSTGPQSMPTCEETKRRRAALQTNLSTAKARKTLAEGDAAAERAKAVKIEGAGVADRGQQSD